MAKLAGLWLLFLAIACTTGDENVETGKFGATCTMVMDTGSSECESGTCTDAFEQLGTVCSVKCSGDASVCPSGSEGMKCNMKGYCRP